MDEEMFDDMPEIQMDPVAGRGDALIRLAAAVDRTVDEYAKGMLLAYMEKVLLSIKLPPLGELVEFKGGMQ